jgi:hypothetical protein
MNDLLLTIFLILAIWYLARKLRVELANLAVYVAFGVFFMMAIFVIPAAMVLGVVWMSWLTTTTTMSFGTVLAKSWILLVIGTLAIATTMLATMIWPNLGFSDASTERPARVPRLWKWAIKGTEGDRPATVDPQPHTGR